jgi:hypothetical protein
VEGDRAPTYYPHTEAPWYDYSFIDASIAIAYKSLLMEQQARFDPRFTGFNPTDRYAPDPIQRVLQTFPGVFTGIGEFTIHKEFVSGKIPGEVASLQNPAPDRRLDFAAEVGLVVLIHAAIDIPFAKDGSELAYLNQSKAVFKRHPNVTIISLDAVALLRTGIADEQLASVRALVYHIAGHELRHRNVIRER